VCCGEQKYRKARAKDSKPYVDWKNQPYAANAGTEEKRRQGERWAALNEFVRRNGGAVTSTPNNKTLRIETPKDSALPSKLEELGYVVVSRGTVMRVTGVDHVSAHDEFYGARASPFSEMACFEITLSGK
jgi:hypothetical protein